MKSNASRILLVDSEQTPARGKLGIDPFTKPILVTVLLFPGFSQLSLSGMIDPLRMANTVSGKNIFQWNLISPDGEPVKCASGITVNVDGDVFGERSSTKVIHCPDYVILCSGEGVENFCSGPVAAWLRLCVRRRANIYALGTATWLLAQLGLLSSSTCTIHWDKLAALSETFYGIDAKDALFWRDGRFVTCAGELAAFDLAINLLKELCEPDVVNKVCQHIIADRGRPGETCQFIPTGLHYNDKNEKLVAAIRLMQQNLETPISLDYIASRIGLCRRQIERLFDQNLEVGPGNYYRDLRLARSKQLLLSTNLSITNVAVACGFRSSSHFSKRFRDKFNCTPFEVRAQR